MKFSVAPVNCVGKLINWLCTWQPAEQIAKENRAKTEQGHPEGCGPVSVPDDASWLPPTRARTTEVDDASDEQNEQDLEDRIRTKWPQVRQVLKTPPTGLELYLEDKLRCMHDGISARTTRTRRNPQVLTRKLRLDSKVILHSLVRLPFSALDRFK